MGQPVGMHPRDAIPTLEKLTEHTVPQIAERAKAALSVDMYADIWEAATWVAEAKGLKLVLRKRELIPGAPLENIQRHHERVTVVYAAPELDVTEDVIRMLK